MYRTGTPLERRPVIIYRNAIGIVAEYDPLHGGHIHHIRQAREKTGDRRIVVALSSYFTQRGDPALLSKWDRAETAIHAGANLVLELPAFFSCQNAGVFAGAAVDILEATGLVSSLSFGMEQPDFPVDPILDIVVQEPLCFKDALKKNLAEGISYVRSRALALSDIHPQYGAFISQPNNSLALSYMERIRKKRYDLNCIPVQRVGAFHHDRELGGGYPSAAAIRSAYREGRDMEAQEKLPGSTVGVIRRCLAQGRVVRSSEMLWRIARSALSRVRPEDLAGSSAITEGMENRLLRFAFSSRTWEEFISRCSTTRYPKGRIRRQVLHFLLGVTQEENLELQRGGVPYVRPLAADERGCHMLRTMRKSASLPVVGKLPPSSLHGPQGRIASVERTAAILWESLTEGALFGSEAKRAPFIASCSSGGENAPEDGGIPREAPSREPPPRTDRSL